MLLASQGLQIIYPMLEESFQLCGVHGCPVKPFVMTGTNGRRVEEGVALVDRDQIKLTRIRGALREEHIAVSSAVRVPQDNICQVEPKEGGRDPMRAAR